MFVELHILQNFAPANLNRDDTNAPKDCEFGGYRRARISSQCLKRAGRQVFKQSSLLPPDRLAVRTKRVVDAITKRLESAGRPADEASMVVESALAGLKIKVDEKNGKTQYLLYLGYEEMDRLTAVCDTHWDALLAAANAAAGAKAGKKADKGGVPADIIKQLNNGLDGGKAADLALFGRMLADLPDRNVDAAAQVAHAISTNKVSMEFDFYTAVDDLKPEDTAGADMLGTVEFNSSCFYRYANVDTNQLTDNLDGDVELAANVVRAYLQALVTAIPTGKQNSMAAHNPPSLVFAVVRRSPPQNLANAFVQPARPTSSADLVQVSIQRLGDYWSRLQAAYGNDGIDGTWVCSVENLESEELGRSCGFSDLTHGVVAAAFPTESAPA